MTKREFKTPYDNPVGLIQKLTYPSMEKAYREGVEKTIETLTKMDWDKVQEETKTHD